MVGFRWVFKDQWITVFRILDKWLSRILDKCYFSGYWFGFSGIQDFGVLQRLLDGTVSDFWMIRSFRDLDRFRC